VSTNAVYVTQALALGAIGAALGCAIGLVLQLIVPVVLGDFLPVDVTFRVSWSAIAVGFAAGVLLTLVFALLPLATIAGVSPLAAIRRAVESGGRRSVRQQVLLTTFIGLCAGAVVVLQAPQPFLGVTYAIGLTFV